MSREWFREQLQDNKAEEQYCNQYISTLFCFWRFIKPHFSTLYPKSSAPRIPLTVKKVLYCFFRRNFISEIFHKNILIGSIEAEIWKNFVVIHIQSANIFQKYRSELSEWNFYKCVKELLKIDHFLIHSFEKLIMAFNEFSSTYLVLMTMYITRDPKAHK